MGSASLAAARPTARTDRDDNTLQPIYQLIVA